MLVSYGTHLELFHLSEKLGFCAQMKAFFKLHSRATERKKDKIWVQKTVLQQIIITRDEFMFHYSAFVLNFNSLDPTSSLWVIKNPFTVFPSDRISSNTLSFPSLERMILSLL